MLACLKKAAKLTTQVMDQSAQVQLHNELLNTYLYFFNQEHPEVRAPGDECESVVHGFRSSQIDIGFINGLVEKLQGEMGKLDPSVATSPSNESEEFIRTQIQKTFDFLRQQQSTVDKFQGLQINS